MQIITQNIGRKFRREWIFRNVALTLTAGQSYTFVGPNGSGKSTLLQVLAGALPASEGELRYVLNNRDVAPDEHYRYVVMAAPYLELIEELTLSELLQFHQQFKPLKAGLTSGNVVERLGLPAHKEIKAFSSGMKQRVKLGLAFFSEASIVILDEPTANLDAAGAAWYAREVRNLGADQLLLIGSNQPAEYDFCSNVLDMGQWK